MRTILAFVLGCAVTACGSSNPPNRPTPATWNLSGTVRASVGGAIIAGATIAILDGPDHDKQAVADAAGHYSFTGLQQAGFSVRVTAAGFTTVTQGVTLIANTVTDFQLPRLPVAVLSSAGNLVFTPRADGRVDLTATAINSGEGCASAISGDTTVTGSTGLILSFSWSLSPTFVTRPNDQFTYSVGPVTRNELLLFGNSGTYTTKFTFTTVACS